MPPSKLAVVQQDLVLQCREVVSGLCRKDHWPLPLLLLPNPIRSPRQARTSNDSLLCGGDKRGRDYGYSTRRLLGIVMNESLVMGMSGLRWAEGSLLWIS